MATKYWRGTATAVAQVGTCQVTAYDAATTYNILVAGVVIATTIAQGSVNATATALRTAWNASQHVYATGITAAGATDSVSLTADTAGVPFTVTTSESGGAGTIGDYVATTASAGPNDWSTATNWSDNAIPADNDTIIFQNNSVNVAWGLDQTGVDLTLLRIDKTYTGRIGLDLKVFAQSSDGATTTSSAKYEYREDYLKCGWSACSIGEHFGSGTPSGSGRLKLSNTLGAASVTTVYDTASASTETGLPAVRLLTAHASAEIYVRNAPAGVGIACDEPGETSTVGTIAVDAESATTSMLVGPGTTITTYRQSGGDNVLQAAATVTTVGCIGGTLTTEGDYTITAMNCDGGTTYSNHIKTGGNAITTANIDGGTLDGKGSTRARTWATVNLNGPGAVRADGDYVTITTLNEPAAPYSIQVS